jgi:galactokinase
MTDLIKRLRDAFRQAFHAEPAFVARAPGRVNLLGEHVDYNDGWVLPAAIDRAAYLAVGECPSSLVSLSALDLDDGATFRITELEAKVDVTGKPLKSWARYPAGVAWALKARSSATPAEGLAVTGMDAVLASDVPRGAGLSSSAALEVVFATAWQRLGGWSLAPMDMALTCQRAENEYVGVNCGIMDQFASACGRADHALLLDCRTLVWEPVPLPRDISIVVADTMVRRELGRSEYNVRRAQCEEAVRSLSEVLPGVKALRDVSVEDFNRHAARLSPVVERRARHVVEECARTRAAADILKAGRVADFGALMAACHASLRDLYEVSCPELDAMVEAARKIEGCYGARLTGAGFGGCTVNLVSVSAAEDFKRALTTQYEKAAGTKPEIYVCRASEGAGILDVDMRM